MCAPVENVPAMDFYRLGASLFPSVPTFQVFFLLVFRSSTIFVAVLCPRAHTHTHRVWKKKRQKTNKIYYHLKSKNSAFTQT